MPPAHILRVRTAPSACTTRAARAARSARARLARLARHTRARPVPVPPHAASHDRPRRGRPPGRTRALRVLRSGTLAETLAEAMAEARERGNARNHELAREARDRDLYEAQYRRVANRIRDPLWPHRSAELPDHRDHRELAELR